MQEFYKIKSTNNRGQSLKMKSFFFESVLGNYFTLMDIDPKVHAFLVNRKK